MDSCFGDGLSRFEGNDPLLEPCGRTAAPEAALAAELRCCQAGWTRRGCCRDRHDSDFFSPPKAARCHTGHCLVALWHSHPRGGLPQHLQAHGCPASCPKPSLEVPLLLPVFGQLGGDGSFRQETLRQLILSLLFPRLPRRAVKKKPLLFSAAFQAVPLSRQLPKKLCPQPGWAHPGLPRHCLASPSGLPRGREKGKREQKKVRGSVQRGCLLQPWHKPRRQGDMLEECLRPTSPSPGPPRCRSSYRHPQPPKLIPASKAVSMETAE